MGNRTLEKNMMSSQQRGLITFKNVINALIDSAIDFKVITHEHENDNYIIKDISGFGILNFPYSLEISLEIDKIRFVLLKNSESMICFFKDGFSVYREDCFNGFDLIIESIANKVKEREAV